MASCYKKCCTLIIVLPYSLYYILGYLRHIFLDLQQFRRKEVGIDGISNEMMKIIDDDNFKVLMRIMNELFEKGEVPTEWNVGVVSQLYKGKDAKGDGPRLVLGLDFGGILRKLSQKHVSFWQNLIIEDRRLKCKYIVYG